ncbi:MAG: type II/IV secretion system ATPase subunit, partial [Candidatus Aenigmarchaeota archaeon]|nr:type II/IV secretion system ATPase subunit [Candidatus Aenigmarchaeota archaeon]
KPTKSEFAEPERMRDVFYNIGRDMLSEIAKNMNIELDKEKLDLLATILVRYTAGYGVLEVLLSDPKVQDIYINSPVGESPVFLFHQDHEDCVTNIIPTKEDSLAWATRFRIESGRPLDEANPVLDTEISIPGGRARVAAITKTLSPEGLAFALRRHRDKPWTYPLFIKNRALTPLAAGLLSFITDGARTILFAGTRSSGKSSFLGATLTEIMKNLRIVTVEDTLELPVEQLRALGYNIERLKSRSVITHIESELPTEEVIRTSLRLGDSCLIIGEVRSKEALALYESMRIGALANVVAGTIHGDSPYGVFDRVVNDLGVPPTSFKATDIIVVANRLKSADGLHTSRRIIEITEVRKDWDKDPQREKGFVPLMVYNSKTDELEPTETFLNGESLILSEIAKRVRDWRDNWEAVWDNIQLRAKLKETLVDYSTSMNKPSLLEAEFVISANNQFHLLSESVREEYGNLDSDRIFARWNEWAKNEIKSMR